MSINIDLSLAGVARTKNGLIMPAGVVFYYLHREDGSAGGCVCLGAVVGKKPARLCRGVSFCSRKDRFSKAIGRELAYRRFLLAVIRKENSEPIRRPCVGGMGGLTQWYMSDHKSCFDVGSTSYKSCSGAATFLSSKEMEIWKRSKAKPADKAAPAKTAAKPIRLNAEDLRNLVAARSPLGAWPRCRHGKMLDTQWRSWQKLQRAGLARIESGAGGEAQILRAMPAAKTVKGKRT